MVGGEATWIGLLGMGIPLIFVPDDFDEDLYRWPSIAHEVGHVLLRGVPGLLDEMGQAAGWTDRPDLLRVERGQIVGSPVQAWSAWREEIFADAFTVLMLGPAALLGFEAVFARPENPAEVLQARAYRGRYAPHPPAHLRLHLSAFLLEELGFIQEGRAAVRSWWNALHGFPEVADAEDENAPSLVLPLADGRVVGMSVEGALARGTEHPTLAPHPVPWAGGTRCHGHSRVRPPARALGTGPPSPPSWPRALRPGRWSYVACGRHPGRVERRSTPSHHRAGGPAGHRGPRRSADSYRDCVPFGPGLRANRRPDAGGCPAAVGDSPAADPRPSPCTPVASPVSLPSIATARA